MQAKLLAALFALTAMPAYAQSTEPVRYQLISVSGGFVRLDTVSGVMTFCHDEVDSFRCSPISADSVKPDDSAKTKMAPAAGADPKDDENAMRGDSDRDDGMANQEREDDSRSAGREPDRQDDGMSRRRGFRNQSSDEDFDRAMSMMDRAMKHFMAMSKESQKDCAL
jgi:hypothetical protein